MRADFASRVVCLAALSFLGAGSVFAMDDAVVTASPTAFRALGRYGVHKAVVVGDVVDMRQVGEPTAMGVVCNSLYRIVSQERPEVYVRAALEATVDSLGLAPQAGEEGAVRVNARVWRARAWCLGGGASNLFRMEINMDFELIDTGGEVLARTSVLGDAQSKTQSFLKKKIWSSIFEEALVDAMEELIASDGLRHALGPEVSASFAASTPERVPAHKVTRIDYSKRSGPSKYVATIKSVDLSPYSSLVLEDFEMTDASFTKSHSEEEIGFARALLAGEVFERLGGMYPGLFSEVVHGNRRIGSPDPTTKRLIVRGCYRDFKPGNVLKRALVQFGAGRISFEADISLVDAESGEVLVTFRVDVINFQSGEGELEDIVDTTAADIAYYLQKNRDASYVSPVLADHSADAARARR